MTTVTEQADLARPAALGACKCWCASFLTAGLLYVATANRGPQWQDSGWQQVRIVSGQLEHELGLALCHPVQYYLGRIAIRIPHLEPAFAITLVSSLAAAIAVANLATTVQLLTRRAMATVIAIAALMLSHTFWQHATYTESYAIVAAFLTGEWLCLALFALTGRPRYIALLGLLNGLGIATHLLAALALPADVAVLIWVLAARRCSWRTALVAAALWVCGTLPYSLLVLDAMLQTNSFTDTVHSALFGRSRNEVLNVSISARTLALSIGYFAYNFPGLTVPLAVYGVSSALRRMSIMRWLAAALLFELVLYALFVVRYSVQDQYAFFFPVYLLCVLFAGVGLARVLTWPDRRLRQSLVAAAAITAVWTPAIYLGTASALRSRSLLQSMVANKPYRDGYRAFFLPWGVGVNCAQKLNAAVRSLAGPRGLVLIEDHMMSFSLQYARLTGDLPETLTLELLQSEDPDGRTHCRPMAKDHLDAGLPVILVPRNRDHPGDDITGARWQRHGGVYQLVELE